MLTKILLSVTLFAVLYVLSQVLGKKYPQFRGIISTIPSVSVLLLIQQTNVSGSQLLPVIFSYTLGMIPAMFFYLGVFLFLQRKYTLNLAFLAGFVLWSIAGVLQTLFVSHFLSSMS